MGERALRCRGGAPTSEERKRNAQGLALLQNSHRDDKSVSLKGDFSFK